MSKSHSLPRPWTVSDSLEVYGVRHWGGGYLTANPAGELVVMPNKNEQQVINLKELVEEVRKRGIQLPLLIRFSDILKTRIVELNEAFKNSVTEYGYKSVYKGVYPIKVNQHRFVVEEIVEYGQPYHYGLEAGSKPELLAVLAMLDDPEALIICNGYKDEEYIETALEGSRLGRTIILVVEKESELVLIAKVAKRTGVKPRIGMRVKLASRGSGKWEASGGDRSKFGLSARELMEALKFLREHEMLDCFELMHFHLGSQISAIRSVKEALREATRFYVELIKQGCNLKYLDVGGGLGIDYDGSQTNFSSSINYTMQEYANDIVFGVMDICDRENVPHPTLVSESGRAVVAHHSVLVVDVLGVSEFSDFGKLPEKVAKDAASPVLKMFENYKELTRKNLLESYHDALEYKEECLNLFSLGHLKLEERVLAEDFFWATCLKILRFLREADEIPEELEGLERNLSDTYFCNFSMFQSLPDSWAVDQLFPIVPVNRLQEEPTRRAVLADITCDSDGKIDQFIDRRDVKSVLELHPLTGDDYFLAVFLVGAYQEILGDLHNLFGNTNTVHVSLGPEGTYHIDHVVPGDTVNDVLKYVNYTRDGMIEKMRKSIETALRTKQMTLEQSRHFLRMFELGLSGYTYLERED